MLWWVTNGRACAPPASRWRIGRLDLDEAVARPACAGTSDEGVADLEDPAGLLVDDEVGVALAVAGVGVGEALPLVGQRPHGLGQQLEALDLDRQLALAGRHDGALDPDPVAEVERIEGLVRAVAEHGPGDEELDLPGPVPHGGEGQLPWRRMRRRRPATATRASVSVPGGQLAVRGPQLAQGRAAVEAVRVRVRARRRGGPRAWPAARLLGGQAGGLLDVGGLVVLHGPVTLARPDARPAAGCRPALAVGRSRRTVRAARRGPRPRRNMTIPLRPLPALPSPRAAAGVPIARWGALWPPSCSSAPPAPRRPHPRS